MSDATKIVVGVLSAAAVLGALIVVNLALA